MAISRHASEFQQKTVAKAVGARHVYFTDVGNVSSRTFKGRLSKHRLILMRIGSLSLQRGEDVYFVEEGDGLLLPAGAGAITFLQCPKSRGLEAEFFEFDVHTVAPRFRNSPGWEQIAYEFNGPVSGPIHFPRMSRAMSTMDQFAVHGCRFSMVMGELFQQYRAGLESFLRSAFYLSRWKLLMILEKFVTQSDGVAKLAAKYPNGAKQLKKDCRLYAGATPETIIAKRRCQLATAWLRCGHSIDDVGKALGFSSSQEFQSFYSGRMRRSCSAVQKMPPLSSLGPDELDEVMRPWWWKDRPSRIQIPCEADYAIMSPIEADHFEREMVEEEMRRRAEAQNAESVQDAESQNGEKVADSAGDVEAVNSQGAANHACNVDLPMPADAGNDTHVEMVPEPAAFMEFRREVPEVPEDPAVRRQRARDAYAAKRAEEAEYLAEKRAKVAAEMRESAADFFAMKSTGANIIVPIFDDKEIMEALAA